MTKSRRRKKPKLTQRTELLLLFLNPSAYINIEIWCIRDRSFSQPLLCWWFVVRTETKARPVVQLASFNRGEVKMSISVPARVLLPLPSIYRELFEEDKMISTLKNITSEGYIRTLPIVLPWAIVMDVFQFWISTVNSQYWTSDFQFRPPQIRNTFDHEC